MSTGLLANPTTDYDAFTILPEGHNRAMDLRKHARLEQSMAENGYLKSFPISCYRDEQGQLVVKDGQHRLYYAKKLGVPVYWVEEEQDYSVAEVAGTVVPWTLKDHAQTWASSGNEHYAAVLSFSEEHGLPLGDMAALMAGYMRFKSVQSDFFTGQFRVTNMNLALKVATAFHALKRANPGIKRSIVIQALASVAMLPDADITRLVENAARCPDRVQCFSKREAVLDMLEDVYNYGRGKKHQYPLKFHAQQQLKERYEEGAKRGNATQAKRRAGG